MIKPTVGRVVWFWFCADDAAAMGVDPKQPMAATVTYVHDDNMVNLSVVDHNGRQFGLQSVILVQGKVKHKPLMGAYCEWMPYQLQSAAKQADVHPAIAAMTQITP